MKVYKNRRGIVPFSYFLLPEHIEFSIHEGHKLVEELLVPASVDIEGARILDISGGNGHVADELRKMGADPKLTEVDSAALHYAREELGIDSKEFFFERGGIHRLFDATFDIVLMRACVMFCTDLDAFLADLKKCLAIGAHVVIQYSVVPTIGTLLRVQVDPITYFALYQPEYLIAALERHGFRLRRREDESDPAPYVYDHDRSRVLTNLRIRYERRALRVLPFESPFFIRARDRRRSNLVFEYAGEEAP